MNSFSSATRPSARVVVVLGLVAALLLPLFVGTAGAQARTSTERSFAAAVSALINSERHAYHLRGLRVDAHLNSSARSHNLAMARANTMSHQVRGESPLGRRMDRAGYRWTRDGENVAWNTRMTQAGVLMMQKAMFNERPPANGHRQNILSRHFRHVGIDVYLDYRHHKVWLTTDFGNR